MNRQSRKIIIHVSVLICLLVANNKPLFAQLDGARVYWPLPKNTNIVGVHAIFGTVNAALSNWEFAQPNVNIQNNLYMLTYTRHQPVFNRTAMWTIVLPVGQIRTNSSLLVPGPTSEFVHGVGDPSISATINVYGAPGLKAKEYARYDLSTTIAFRMNASFPIGQYDKNEASSMGSNQYKVRLAVPMVKALSAWVPGKRLAVDVMPSVVFFSNNNDYRGQEVDQKPVLMVETHLSRDLTKKAFISLDYSFIRGGEATYIDKQTGVTVRETGAMNTHLLGMTVNFQINDNLQLFLTHLQTFAGEEEPVTLDGALVKATMTWSWHDVLQRAKDFHE